MGDVERFILVDNAMESYNTMRVEHTYDHPDGVTYVLAAHYDAQTAELAECNRLLTARNVQNAKLCDKLDKAIERLEEARDIIVEFCSSGYDPGSAEDLRCQKRRDAFLNEPS